MSLAAALTDSFGEAITDSYGDPITVRTGLDAGLVAGFDLQEADTALCFRNRERKLVFEYDFTTCTVGTTDAYGDVPLDWLRYASSLEADETFTSSLSSAGLHLHGESAGTPNDYFGLRRNIGVVAGTSYAIEVTYALTERTAGEFAVNAGGNGYKYVANTVSSLTRTAVVTPATSNGFIYLMLNLASVGMCDVVVQRIAVYEENAAAKYGTLPNQVAGPGGSLPYAQEFNGTSDYATPGGRITSGSLAELSVAAHVRCDATSGVSVIASEFNYSGNQRGWFIGYDASLEALYVYLSADGGTTNAKAYLAYSASNAGWDITTWTHVAFTFGDGTLELFVNGRKQTISKSTDGGVLSVFDSSARFEIGHRQTVATEYWDGAIGDLRIYNRALPSHEIAQLVALGPLRLQEVGLLAHYKLDEQEGTTLRATPSETLRTYDFTDGVSGTDAYGDIPTGGWRYTSGLEGDETTSCVVGSDSLTISLAAGATGSDYLGVNYAGVAAVGVAYVAKIRYRVLAISGVCEFKASVGYGAAWKTFGSSSDPLGEWVEKTVPLGLAAITSLLVAIYATDASASMTVEVDSIEFIKENAATLSGDTADNMTTAGVIGRCLQFSGIESGVGSFGGGLEYPFSFTGWVWRPTGGSSGFAASFHDIGNAAVYYGLNVTSSSGQVNVYRRNTTQISNATGVYLPPDQWFHVALVFLSATHAKLFVNGVLEWEDDALTSVPSSTGTDGMLLGDYRTTDVGAQWDGKLDDWRFYARGLGDSEPRTLWEAGLTPLIETDARVDRGVDAYVTNSIISY